MAIINNSEVQVSSSYTIEFYQESDTYPLSTNPNSYLTIEIYDENDDLYHSVTNLPQEEVYPYTFNSNDVGDYTVVYKVYSGDPLDAPDESSPISFTVYEWMPTFTLPVITCAELNIPFNFTISDWDQNENNLCPASPLDAEVTYERYEFNLDTQSYVLKETYGPLSISETGAVDGGDYIYTWTPDKLAMVKIVATISNCSTTVEKATVFPVCGSWKIRRLACGDYRIYNYKNSNISYDVFEGVDSQSPVISNETIPAFSYVSIPSDKLNKDAIYKVVADGIIQYIFNYCSIENCVLELQKKILLDCELCNECKMDKVLYQKALRLLPVYETWKKLLDKDWVYDVQYKTTDIGGGLEALYDAEELYQELKKLCVECESTTSKNCGCK